MWYDKMPMLNYFDRAYKFIELMHRYGMRNLMIRDHQGMYGQYSPKRRGQPGNYEICPESGRDDPGATIWNEHNQNTSKNYCGKNPGVSNHPNVVNAVYLGGQVKANTLNATSQAYEIYTLAAYCDDFK